MLQQIDGSLGVQQAQHCGGSAKDDDDGKWLTAESKS